MSHTKHGMKVLGLSIVAATVFMTIGVMVAQAAEDEGDFTAGGVSLAAGETLLGIGLDMKLLVPSIGLNVLCNTDAEGSALGGSKATNGIAHATFRFTGCSVFDNKGFLNHTCLIDDFFVNVSAQVVLVKGFTTEGFVLLKPIPGQPFATIQTLNAIGKECTLELEYEVKGTLLTKASFDATHNSSCTEGGGGLELFLKEATAAQSTAGGDDLLVGTHSATIDGCVFTHYTGPKKAQLVGIKNL